MNVRPIALFLIISFFVCAVRVKGQTAQVSNQDRTTASLIAARLRARVEGTRRSGRLPGLQVGFAFVDGLTPDGRPKIISGSFASGVFNLTTDTPLKTTDRMPVGSVANTFLAALALLLSNQGKLQLDDKISKWFGSEKWFSQLPNANDITLRMLLNQSSGIENHAADGNFEKQWLKSSGRNITREELLAYVLNKKPLFKAGTDYAYSETNYVLAGMAIEKATGQKLTDLIVETFIKPYKLDRTIPSDSLTLPEVATGYLKGKPVIVDGKFSLNPQWEWGEGGFASTAEDLARWANVLYGGDVLPKTAMDQMLNSVTTGEGIVYGIGVVIARSKWGRTYGHDGEFPGYLSEIRYYTKHKLAISMMVNSDETPDASRALTSAVDDFAEVIIQANTQSQNTPVDRTEIQKLVEGWLSLLDSSQFDKAWDDVAERLKSRISKREWERMMRGFQDDNGKLKSRNLITVTSPRPGTKLLAVQFESEFSKVPNATESLLLEFEDGKWKVTSYAIR